MFIFVERDTRKIRDVSPIRSWDSCDSTLYDTVEVPGDPATHVWPNGLFLRCLYTEAGEIIPDPTWVDRDDVRDAYVAAKAAMEEFAANSTLATAKPAIIKLGQCVEELLKFLNRRIS